MLGVAEDRIRTVRQCRAMPGAGERSGMAFRRGLVHDRLQGSAQLGRKGRDMVSVHVEAGDEESDGLFMALMPRKDFVRAAGRFEGDATAMLRQSVQTAGRAFDELDACHEVLDRAATEGQALAAELARLLAAEDEKGVARLVDLLKDLAAEVRRSEEIRVVVSRILGQAEQPAGSRPPVPHLTEQELPRIPTLYDDEDGEHYTSLQSMLDARAERLPERAHAERLAQVVGHLHAVVARTVEQGFADGVFATASLEEACSAQRLWLRCLAQRCRDLG
ncbi:hypothetical protein ACGFZP_38990 [Kitasatospora sp. NPDC048239]|uniref:hypothetical protein n=1 Tax=Kitasatospora sp. NPDC048239 TaxID=3364046 RepID=UPI003718EB80